MYALLPLPFVPLHGQVTASKLSSEDDEPPAGAAAGGGGGGLPEAAVRARSKLVSALMKRHLVEGVVPVMVELRRMLTEEKHPLLADLMRCFASLLKEYKGEIEEILVADKLVGGDGADSDDSGENWEVDNANGGGIPVKCD